MSSVAGAAGRGPRGTGRLAVPRISCTRAGSEKGSKGLATTARAPRPSSRCTSEGMTDAVSRITGMEPVAGLLRSAVRVVGPSMNGIITSRMMTSGFCSAAIFRHSAPPVASMTWMPCMARVRRTSSRESGSSSVTRTFTGASQPSTDRATYRGHRAAAGCSTSEFSSDRPRGPPPAP